MADRAAILKVGVCEQADDGEWLLTAWWFDCQHTEEPAFRMDYDGAITAVAGWTLPELRAISNAEMELAALPTTDAR